MLTDVKNAELYRDWHDFLEEPAARQAFLYLIGIAACSSRYSCHIQWKGEVRDFRFHDMGGEQPFAFITNKRWLLFYFRLPAVRSSTIDRAMLAADFDSFNENAAGEWTVKLRCVGDVDRLLRHVVLA